jgi:anti-sigma factor RsiW
MLSEEVTWLLTAYVDGELSARQKKAVMRLLERSSEARELLRQLQESAEKLKRLPRRTLDAGFADEVLRVIAERSVRPGPASLPKLPLRWVPYAAAGVAAALFFALTLGAALYLADRLKEPSPMPGAPVANLPAAERPPERDVPASPHKPNPLIASVTEGVYRSFAAPIPQDKALSLTFADLQKDGQAGAQLASELKKSQGFEIDLTVRNNPQAVEKLKAVLAQSGIKLVIDPGSDATLKKGPAKAEFLVYAENVNPEELAKILRQLAAVDKKSANPFDKVVVASLSQTGQSRVADLLGADPMKRDPGGTQGMKQPGKNPKGPPPKAERVAVVLPPAPAPKASDEVRLFLLQPARPDAGSVRVLIRVHQD